MINRLMFMLKLVVHARERDLIVNLILLYICQKLRHTSDRSMKWVVESSPAAVTRRSGKTTTLRLSGGCHPTERSWMEVGRVKRRLFIASTSPFPRVYDHSLPHNRLATGDVEGEWCTCAPIGPSCSSPCSRLLPD
ncbi:unnamed protein product [Spirodela intermedia]|uniref:Uncharacterized protein n=1 Tax=Spirodela intermedia TaxID=51605 RepID=A0A7I8LJQ1_SPIIN|nr:unnamed protein product [Spirodela intermedia]